MRIVCATLKMALAGAALGCAPARMAVPPDLAKQGETLPITERSSWSGALANESFRLGPFQVADVDRKWDSSSSLALGPYAQGKSEGGYAFTFKTPAGDARGTCAIRTSGEQVDVGGGVALGREGSSFICSCQGPGAEGQVVLSRTQDSLFGGPMTTRAGQFAAFAVHADEKGHTTGDPLGFAVKATNDIGAVEIERPGRVWLARSLDDKARTDVACLFAGLLLYLPPGGSTLAK